MEYNLCVDDLTSIEDFCEVQTNLSLPSKYLPETFGDPDYRIQWYNSTTTWKGWMIDVPTSFDNVVDRKEYQWDFQYIGGIYSAGIDSDDDSGYLFIGAMSGDGVGIGAMIKRCRESGVHYFKHINAIFYYYSGNWTYSTFGSWIDITSKITNDCATLQNFTIRVTCCKVNSHNTAKLSTYIDGAMVNDLSYWIDSYPPTISLKPFLALKADIGDFQIAVRKVIAL